MIIKDEYTATLEQDTVQEKRKNRGKPIRGYISYARIFWPAIFAGAVIITTSQLLFSLLGVGIGLSTVDPLREADPFEGLGVAAIIWWSASMFVALFFGGWATGRLCKTIDKEDANFNGILTWSVFSISSFLILSSSLGTIFKGAGNVAGNLTSTVAAAGDFGGKGVDLSDFKSEAGLLFFQSDNSGKVRKSNASQGGSENEAQSDRVYEGVGTSGEPSAYYQGKEIDDFFGKSENISDSRKRQKLVNALVQHGGISAKEANARIDKWTDEYRNMENDLRVKGEKASKATSTASLMGFAALVLGAFVTTWGTRVGLPIENTEK